MGRGWLKSCRDCSPLSRCNLPPSPASGCAGVTPLGVEGEGCPALSAEAAKMGLLAGHTQPRPGPCTGPWGQAQPGTQLSLVLGSPGENILLPPPTKQGSLESTARCSVPQGTALPSPVLPPTAVHSPGAPTDPTQVMCCPDVPPTAHGDSAFSTSAICPLLGVGWEGRRGQVRALQGKSPNQPGFLGAGYAPRETLTSPTLSLWHTSAL